MTRESSAPPSGQVLSSVLRTNPVGTASLVQSLITRRQFLKFGHTDASYSYLADSQCVAIRVPLTSIVSSPVSIGPVFGWAPIARLPAEGKMVSSWAERD